MIKEKSKNKKKKKSFAQIIGEYLRTIFLSIIAAAVITTSLTIRARHDMIKNIYKNAHEQKIFNQEFAKQIVAQSDLIETLPTKNFTVCIQVGNLYESAGNYKMAQYAYKLAVDKAKPGSYSAQGKLVSVYIAQSEFDKADELLDSIMDVKSKDLIKCKTRAYIEMGDKYYSIGKTLKAAHNYEKAKYYYTKLSKKDKYIVKSLDERLIHSYVETADTIVKNGYNSDAVRFLNKARELSPNDYNIQYKLAIIYADLDPIKAVEAFEYLFDKKPQYIDYTVYSTALMKAANIEDIKGNTIQAKYYRYRVHSIDMFINNKVIYKDDIDVLCKSFLIKKFLFKYRLNAKYVIKNLSPNDITNMTIEFVLRQGDKEKERYLIKPVSKNEPLLSNGSETPEIEVNFGKNTSIYTKKELEQYAIDVFVFKDEKFKTLFGSFKIPEKSF